jgi:heme exporter protein B
MRAALAVMEKDLRLAWRDRAGWLTAVSFAAISILVYSFALDLAARDVRPLLPGLLWVTFLFAGIVSSGASFQTEGERGTLDAQLLAPVARTALYAGKLLANLLALLVVEVATLGLATILFDESLLTLELGGIVLLGTAGYVSLVTVLATLGSRVRARAVLMPVLALPLLVPLLIAAVRATGGALGEPTGDAPWLLLLAVFAVWAAVGSALLFPLAIER